MTTLYIEQIHNDARALIKASKEAACYDVRAYIHGRFIKFFNTESGTEERMGEIFLHPGERCLVPTGLKMCCDPDYRIAIYPRSGLSIRLGVTLINNVGIIDSDYRDEVFIALVNHGETKYQIKHGARIAQLAVEPVLQIMKDTGILPVSFSNRNGGFGSTGE